MRMEIPNDPIARKLNPLTVFFPTLAPRYEPIILNVFDTIHLDGHLCVAAPERLFGNTGVGSVKLVGALKNTRWKVQSNCILQYLTAKFHDETVKALVKEKEGSHDG